MKTTAEQIASELDRNEDQIPMGSVPIVFCGGERGAVFLGHLPQTSTMGEVRAKVDELLITSNRCAARISRATLLHNGRTVILAHA